MRELGIVFTGPMVRAIHRGEKDVARWLVKPQPEAPRPVYDLPGADTVVETYRSAFDTSMHGMIYRMSRLDNVEASFSDGAGRSWRCPYGAPGDHLWVKETWAYVGGDEYLYQRDPAAVAWREGYAEDVRFPLADRIGGYIPGGRWRPPGHMPQWASRITLEVVDVRMERLHAITEEDAVREGVDTVSVAEVPRNGTLSRHEDFAQLWEKQHGRGAWAKNPWVWRVEFRRIEATASRC
jgi:hypothetical protein